MKQDFWRFILVIGTSLVIGLVVGRVLLCLLIGAALFIYWQYKTLKRLWQWIHRRGDNAPPDVPGIINEISREFDLLRIHHRQRKEKLSGYLKRFQEATAALPDAVVVLGENSRIEWANSNAGRYLGVHWPQDAGQRISNLIRHPALLEYMRSAGVDDGVRGLELVSPVDQALRLEARIVPYGDTQQLLVARDITRIHHIDRMRRDFIANASHELRTPLTVIAGYLESLEDEAGGRMKKWAGQIEQMRNQTTRMHRLIEDLLKLASLESDAEPAEPEPVNVPELLAGIYEEAKSVGGIVDHIFSLETDGELWLKGNRNELYSAFSNLVFNAVQYTPQGGIIRIHWYGDERGACLDVIDTGEGIAWEHIPRLTERFYRVDQGRSREKGGTGLGLAIVKHALARHNATLEVESKPGAGSQFRCRFPANTIIRKGDLPDLTLSA